MGRFVRAGALILAAGVLTAGCAAPGPTPVEVKGRVTLDGKPMPDGDISFRGNDGRPPAHGTIVNGQYALQVLPGEQRVEVNLYRDNGRKDPYGKPQMESVLPERYNARTELKATVTPGGPNEFNFELRSK